jgi:hypothetical protein
LGAADPAVVALLDGQPAAGWDALPSAPGVAQVLAQDGRPLLTARAANLRRWAQTKLSAPAPAVPGRRPPLDLRPLAAAVRQVRTTSSFHQRLVFERLMAGEVPLHKRKDLKPPLYLRLDLEARFPRVLVQGAGPGALYGPLRDKRAAEAASKALHKLFPLRPCDFDFEPHASLPLGLGCFYAQVRTCAAPCLARIGEDDYRALAAGAAALLADPRARPDDARAWLPDFATRADAPALLIERGKRVVELWPIHAGAVLDEHVQRGPVPADEARVDAWARALAGAFSRAESAPARDDRPWLAAHLFGRPRSTNHVSLDAATASDAAPLAACLREHLTANRA